VSCSNENLHLTAQNKKIKANYPKQQPKATAQINSPKQKAQSNSPKQQPKQKVQNKQSTEQPKAKSRIPLRTVTAQSQQPTAKSQ